MRTLLTCAACACAWAACGGANASSPQLPSNAGIDAGVDADAGDQSDDAAVADEPAPPPVAPRKQVALCSLSADKHATEQCLAWRSCDEGMALTYGGQPFRKCSAKPDACNAAEAQIQAVAQKLGQEATAPKGGAKRVCKNRQYLEKVIRLSDGEVTVCPEDSEDVPLSKLWKQIVETCKQPYAE